MTTLTKDAWIPFIFRSNRYEHLPLSEAMCAAGTSRTREQREKKCYLVRVEQQLDNSDEDTHADQQRKFQDRTSSRRRCAYAGDKHLSPDTCEPGAEGPGRVTSIISSPTSPFVNGFVEATVKRNPFTTMVRTPIIFTCVYHE